MKDLIASLIAPCAVLLIGCASANLAPGAGSPDSAALSISNTAISPAPDPNAPLSDRIVARIRDSFIALSEVQSEALRHWRSEPQSHLTSWRTLYKEGMESLIDDELLCQAAERLGVHVPEPEAARSAEDILKSIVAEYDSEADFESALGQDQLTVGELRARLQRREDRNLVIAVALQSRVSVNNAEVADFARQLRAAGEPTEDYHLRHILILCPADASPDQVESARQKALWAAIEAQQGMTFAEAARRYSEHEATRENGGDLGYLFQGQMASAIEEGVKALAVGEISKPVRSGFGFHVFYLEDKRTPRDKLFAKHMAEERARWIQELRRTEAIETDSQFLMDVPDTPANIPFELLGDEISKD